MVEGTPLLRVQTGNRLEGSNPFVSANFSIFRSPNGLKSLNFIYRAPHKDSEITLYCATFCTTKRCTSTLLSVHLAAI